MARFMASKSVRLPTLIEPSVLPRPVSNKGSSPAPDRDRLPPIRLMCPPTAKTFSDIAIVPGPPISTTQSTRGWRLNDPWAYKYLSLAQELGIKNVHVHKGPTVYPLSADAFDVHDVDYAATDFPELNFIVEHVGLPRLDDFCWIAAQESNVYAGLSVAMAFVHLRPRYFAEIMANLLFWLGPDKLCFGSDYAIWSPKWLIEKFMAFELPEDLKQEYHVDLTVDIKRKILGENAARLYGIDIPAQTAKLSQEGIGLAR